MLRFSKQYLAYLKFEFNYGFQIGYKRHYIIENDFFKIICNPVKTQIVFANFLGILSLYYLFK